MFNKVLQGVVAVIFCLGAGPCFAAGDKVAPAQETGETRVFEVFGMDCPGCHGGIEKLVQKIPGIQATEANWKEQRLVVIIVPGQEVADADIHDAIRRANFTVGKRIDQPGNPE